MNLLEKEIKMTATTFGYAKLDQPEVLALLFHPRPETGTPPAGAVDHEIPVEEGVRLGARFHLTADRTDPNILFFHGNGEIVSDYDRLAPLFTEQSLSLLAVDYRGYGRSTGSPTFTAMLADAHLVLREVRAWLDREERSGPLVVMGRSLGCAPALELASAAQEQITALVIDSGFAFTVPLLLNLGVAAAELGITEADGFRNQLKIAQVTRPTYILHGQHDQLIPVHSAETLQAQSGARDKQFSLIPGADHNTIFERTGKLYFEALRQFISRAAKPARPRRRAGGTTSR